MRLGNNNIIIKTKINLTNTRLLIEEPGIMLEKEKTRFYTNMKKSRR